MVISAVNFNFILLLLFFFFGCEKGILTIFLIQHLQEVNFLKNWFWTLIFLVKIEGNLIFFRNEFLVHGLKIPIQHVQRILIFLITLLLVCFMLIKSLIAEKVYSYILFLFCYYFWNYFSSPYLLTNFELKLILNCGFDCYNGYCCKHIS